MTNKELLEDLLIEFDELGMEPTTIVPNPSERAIRWKRELMSAIEHWGAEVAREIFAEIKEKGSFSDPCVLHVVLSFDELAEIEKKYMEAEPPKGV